MAAMPDHDDLAALLAHLRNLHVHLGYQRTGRVEDAQSPRLRVVAHCLRDAMRAEYDRTPGGYLGQVLHEHRTLSSKIFDYIAVVHDLMPHIDRGAVDLQGTLHDLDRAVDACTESPRLRKDDTHLIDGVVLYERLRCRGSARHCVSGLARERRRLSQISSAAPQVMALSATLNAGQ